MVRSAADTLLANEVSFHLKAIRDLCAEVDVVSLEVFGSASVGPFDPVESDADFLVVFADAEDRRGLDVIGHLMTFVERLAEILDRPVDVTSATSIQNPYFAKSVNRSRRLLYGASPPYPDIPVDVAVTDPVHDRALKLLEDIRLAAHTLVDESEEHSIDGLFVNQTFRMFAERSVSLIGRAAHRLREQDPALFARLPDGDEMVDLGRHVLQDYDAIDVHRLRRGVELVTPGLLSEVERLMAKLST